MRSDTADQVVQRVKRLREGAGLRVGSWVVSNLATRRAAPHLSTLPAFEGYWQKGLDRHLVIETSAGLWHRQETSGSGSSAESVGSFIVPLFTALKLYPFTGPEDRLEPLVTAGAGFVLGLDKQNTVSGGLLGGGGGSSALNLVAGIGVKGAAGVEYRISQAFGLTASSPATSTSCSPRTSAGQAISRASWSLRGSPTASSTEPTPHSVTHVQTGPRAFQAQCGQRADTAVRLR